MQIRRYSPRSRRPDSSTHLGQSDPFSRYSCICAHAWDWAPHSFRRFFLALSCAHIYYSLDARYYSFQILFSLLFFISVEKYVASPEKWRLAFIFLTAALGPAESFNLFACHFRRFMRRRRVPFFRIEKPLSRQFETYSISCVGSFPGAGSAAFAPSGACRFHVARVFFPRPGRTPSLQPKPIAPPRPKATGLRRLATRILQSIAMIFFIFNRKPR